MGWIFLADKLVCCLIFLDIPMFMPISLTGFFSGILDEMLRICLYPIARVVSCDISMSSLETVSKQLLVLCLNVLFRKGA